MFLKYQYFHLYIMFLKYNNTYLPLCELASNTGWLGCSNLSNIELSLNLNEIKIDKDFAVFTKEKLFGIAAILAIAGSIEYYLIMIPQLKSPASLFFLKRDKKITNSINKNISRHGGLCSHFVNRGEMILENKNHEVYLANTSVQFHERLLGKAKQTHDLIGLWDSVVTGIQNKTYSSKVEDRKRKLRSSEDVFDCTDVPVMKRNQDKNKKNQSHVLPKDVINLFHSEELKEDDDVPYINTLRSKDSGGINSIIPLVPQSKDTSLLYLSDYHLATQVPDAYSVPQNQDTILKARKELSNVLVSNGHPEDSPSFIKAIGAVSDKYFEGIEHRMTPEISHEAKITEMKIDIDQV